MEEMDDFARRLALSFRYSPRATLKDLQPWKQRFLKYSGKGGASIFRKAIRERLGDDYAAKLKAARESSKSRRTARLNEMIASYQATGLPMTNSALETWLTANYLNKKNTPTRLSYLPSLRNALRNLVKETNKDAFMDYYGPIVAKMRAARAAKAAERDKEIPWFWNYSAVKLNTDRRRQANSAYKAALREVMINFAKEWRARGGRPLAHGMLI